MFPGEDEGDQLACMMELLGMPPQKLLEQSKRSKVFMTSGGQPRYCQVETGADGNVVLKGGRSKRGKLRGAPGSKSWQQTLKNCDDAHFLDFVQRCLRWQPEERMTPREALKHDWMRKRAAPVANGDKKVSNAGLAAVASQSDANNNQLQTDKSAAVRKPVVND